MNLCLRPCQQPSVEGRYQDEARSFLEYLRTNGDSLREPWEAERDAASEALDFEAAARLHKRLGKLEDCWRGLGDFVGLLNQFDGVAVTRGRQPDTVILWPVSAGRLHAPATVPLQGRSQHEIQQLLSPMLAEAPRPFEETEHEHLAVLTKWKHSTWCDGEWVRIQDREKIPSRRILNAAKRLLAPEAAGVAEGSPDREQETASQPAVEATQLPDHH
jgi:excinuclease UvrABC nuclease subunit